MGITKWGGCGSFGLNRRVAKSRLSEIRGRWGGVLPSSWVGQKRRTQRQEPTVPHEKNVSSHEANHKTRGLGENEKSLFPDAGHKAAIEEPKNRENANRSDAPSTYSLGETKRG